MTTAKNKEANVPFPTWFCLHAGRQNFHIDPDRDQQFLFGKDEWRDAIDEILRRCIALSEPVRLVWWGQYGIGKTHRLRFMQWSILHRELGFHPVQVVCRDIEEKSAFDRLHFDLVNNLRRDEMHPLVRDYVRRLQDRDPEIATLEQLTPSPDIAGAVRRFASGDDEMQTAAWRYLTGEKLSANECKFASVTRNRIDSSVEYAGVVRVFGEIIHAQTGAQLLYLIDQVEALSKIRQRSVEGRWIETLRAVLDVRNVGVVMAIGAEHRFDELPAIMVAPEIIRRFTINNYIEIGAFKRDHTSEFLEGLLTQWVDLRKRDQLAASEGWTVTDDDDSYSPDTYPLTRAAFDIFCRFCSDELDHKTAKPSEIIETLNRVTYEAYDKGQRLIDVQFLKTQGITA